MQQQTFGFQSNASTSSGGLTDLTIANSLFVMKNGNDATGQPARLDLPYLTIYAASQNAQINDTIYVFSGVYDEGTNDVFFDQVNYVLQEGVTVQCLAVTVGDFGVAKTINISGQGKIQNLSNGGSVVETTNPATILNLQCSEINGVESAIDCQGEFNINVGGIFGAKAITLSGEKCSGVINFDNIQSNTNDSSLFQTILIKNANDDLTQRNIFINGKSINAINIGGVSNAVINTLANYNSRIYFTCENIIQQGYYSVIENDSSYLFINNTNSTSNQNGIATYGSAVTLMTNSNFLNAGISFESYDNSQGQLNNTLLKSTSQNAIYLSNGELSIYDCVLVGGDGTRASAVIYIDNNETNPILRLKNTELIETSTFGESIRPLNACDIYIYGQCASNVLSNAAITNQVAGTNIIVDSDVVQNTTNFF